MKYWLFKSEPECFSYDDLLSQKDQTEHWDGVRNYQARNFMRYEMKVGDRGVFYHSNCKPPHAIGSVKIVKEGYPDFTAWDPSSDHPDAKSNPQNPLWFMVDVQAEKKFTRPISLSEMREFVELKDMKLLQKGNRLSVMPIEKKTV
jgi:predicted RNA-binding protein with PUA-like domain